MIRNNGRKANSRSNKKPRPVRQVQNANNRRSDNMRIVPSVINNVTHGSGHDASKITFRGREIIATIVVPNATPAALLERIQLNPLLIGASRLNNVAKSFQKWRPIKFAFTLRPSNPTTVGGSVTVGYSRNPDHEVSSGFDAPNEVFALQNSLMMNLWTATDFRAPVDKEWLFIDPDSTETMKTTAGSIFIANNGDVTATAPVRIPLILEYEVEFAGQSTQPAPSNILVFPACTYGSATVASSSFTLTPLSGEPSLPSFPNMVPMVCTPTATIFQDDVTEVDAEIVTWDGGYWRFYTNYANFLTDTRISTITTTPGGVNRTLPRFTIQPHSA